MLHPARSSIVTVSQGFLPASGRGPEILNLSMILLRVDDDSELNAQIGGFIHLQGGNVAS